ncbi:MAG: hypothetical protein MUE70_15265 [Desulfobacterales bacterium]|jgi:hypothetical protein|nr:hypothetical protein [Desulfobacterales bacterium]
MKKIICVLLVVLLIGAGVPAFAKDSQVDCNCTKGGIGLMMGSFVFGLGVRTFNTLKGCNNAFGVGVGLGSETLGCMIGFGFNEGVIGLGINFVGEEKTTSVGFGLGFDGSDCRMVWPYEE